MTVFLKQQNGVKPSETSGGAEEVWAEARESGSSSSSSRMLAAVHCSGRTRPARPAVIAGSGSHRCGPGETKKSSSSHYTDDYFDY